MGLGVWDVGIVGEGMCVYLSICFIVRGYLVFFSFVSFICVMGMVMLVFVGEGVYIGERGWSWWK